MSSALGSLCNARNLKSKGPKTILLGKTQTFYLAKSHSLPVHHSLYTRIRWRGLYAGNKDGITQQQSKKARLKWNKSIKIIKLDLDMDDTKKKELLHTHSAMVNKWCRRCRYVTVRTKPKCRCTSLPHTNTKWQNGKT